MTVTSHRLGPGSLKFGAVGSEIEHAVSLRECAIAPEVKDGDTLPVLSGDELDEGDEETYKLTGKVLENYDLKSFQVWAHTNAGTVVPFRFHPDSDKTIAITGQVKVRRTGWGGKVKERNEIDFEFPGRGGMYNLVNADDDDSIITVYDADAPGSPPAPGDPWD